MVSQGYDVLLPNRISPQDYMNTANTLYNSYVIHLNYTPQQACEGDVWDDLWAFLV